MRKVVSVLLIIFVLPIFSCIRPKFLDQVSSNNSDAYKLHTEIENSTNNLLFQTLLEELYSKNNPSNNSSNTWPDMPRLVGTISKKMANTTTLQVGVKFNYFGVDTEAVQKINFEMGFEIKLIMITTEKHKPQNLTRIENDQVYFNVIDNTKYVIICQYTNYLNANEDLVGKVLINGNGISNQSEIQTNIVRTNYSQLIPVQRDETVNFYLNTVCLDIFESKVKESVKEDLINLAKSTLTYSNPNDRCIPPVDSSNLDPTGDHSCKKWHSSLLPSIRDWTIPRCQMNSSKNYVCTLKSKVGGSCPMFRDKDTNKLYSSMIPNVTNFQRITSGIFEYYCDTANRLKCQITKPQTWYSPAEAICVKNNFN